MLQTTAQKLIYKVQSDHDLALNEMMFLSKSLYGRHVACENKNEDSVSMYQLAARIPWFAQKNVVQIDHPFGISCGAHFTTFRFYSTAEIGSGSYSTRLDVNLWFTATEPQIYLISLCFKVLTHVDFYWNQINPFGSFASIVVAMFVSAFSHFFSFSFHFTLFYFWRNAFLGVSVSGDLLRTLFHSFHFLKINIDF